MTMWVGETQNLTGSFSSPTLPSRAEPRTFYVLGRQLYHRATFPAQPGWAMRSLRQTACPETNHAPSTPASPIVMEITLSPGTLFLCSQLIMGTGRKVGLKWDPLWTSNIWKNGMYKTEILWKYRLGPHLQLTTGRKCISMEKQQKQDSRNWPVKTANHVCLLSQN